MFINFVDRDRYLNLYLKIGFIILITTLSIQFIKYFIKNKELLTKIRNFFIKLDIYLTLIPLISFITVLLNCYSNVILFFTIIVEKRFVFPDALWIFFPIVYSLFFIILFSLKLIIIKINCTTITTITSQSPSNNTYDPIDSVLNYINNNNNKNNGTSINKYIKVKSLSYGRSINKITVVITLVLMLLLNNVYLYNVYIGCAPIEKYYDLRKRPGVHHINFCWNYHHQSFEFDNYLEITVLLQIFHSILLLFPSTLISVSL